MKKLFIILFAATFVLGCSDDNKVEDTLQPGAILSVSTNELAFLPTGESLSGLNSVEVKSSDDWRLSGKKTWCTPSAVSGKNGETVTFTADPNPESKSRSITYSFICGDKTSKVTVTQNPGSILDIKTESEYNMGSWGGPLSVVVNATSDMTYEISEKSRSWIKENVSRATGTRFLAFIVDGNTSYKSRSGSIIFKVEGNMKEIAINQAQLNFVKFAQTDYPVDAEGAKVVVAFDANVAVVPDVSKFDWITFDGETVVSDNTNGLQTRQLTFTVTKATKTRSAAITVKSADGVQLYATLTFLQQAAAVTANIPDEKFSQFLLAKEFVTLVEGTKYELTALGLVQTEINCANQDISSVEGIGAFEELVNFNCSYNWIKKLDMSNNKKLQTLNCIVNDIAVLDVRNCPLNSCVSTNGWYKSNCLEEVYFDDNSGITIFTVAGTTFNKGRSGTSPSSIIVKGNSLTDVYFLNNTVLKSADISGCSSIVVLKCKKSGIITLYINASQVDSFNNSYKWEKDNTTGYSVIP